MTWFFNYWQPIFKNRSPNDPLFWQHFIKILNLFQNFCQKCVQICIFPGNLKLAKNCLILTIRPPVYGFLTEWPPLFREKSLTKRPQVLSFCLSTPSLPKLSAPPGPTLAEDVCICKLHSLIIHFKFIVTCGKPTKLSQWVYGFWMEYESGIPISFFFFFSFLMEAQIFFNFFFFFLCLFFVFWMEAYFASLFWLIFCT